MSALTFDEEDMIRLKMQAIRDQIVDIEILTKVKYDSGIPLKVKDTVQSLKKNIFDLDISITNKLVE